MWIFLTKKLPTQVSPPRMSIHWAVEWGDRIAIHKQKERVGEYEIESAGNGLFMTTYGYSQETGFSFGYEHNEETALAIYYKGERIKVYQSEYSILTPERMRDYVFGMAGDEVVSHDLVPRAEADALLLKVAEDTALKDVKEAAMLDGCNEMQSLALLMGMDIENASAEFPPVGWFRCKPELALYWCEEWELEE